MGITKSDQFTSEQNEMAEVLKALGHPARIAILQYVLQLKACVCTALVEELPLAQATVSQHLKVLKDVGLIQGTIEGTSICYCINPKKVQEVVQFLIPFSEDKKDSTCC